MNPTVVASVITGVLAVGAGVAIAGLPSEPPAAELVITELPTTTTTTLPIVPDTVAPLSTTTTTTTTTPAETSTSDVPSSTDATSSTVEEQPPVSRPLADRSELFVATANGVGVGGIASSTADALLALGYTDVQPVDVVDPVSDSVVYFAPDQAAEAARLAADLGWPIDRIAPIDQMPELTGSAAFDLVAVIGADQVGPLDDL